MRLEAPPEITELLGDIVVQCIDLLGGTLVGVYLHGSLAMGSFNPDVSDVDFLVVTTRKLTPATRKELARAMLRLSEQAPPKGLEMSVVTQEALLDFTHPTPYEFHFGRDWIDQYRNEAFDFTQENLVDGDLAAHFTIVKARGLTLYGQAIAAVFPDIPEEYYADSILDDARAILRNLSADTSGTVEWANPVYSVLNLCRVRAFFEAGLISSKREGGEWALQHATPFQAGIIRQAVTEYTSSQKQEWSQPALERFGQEMAALLPL